MNILSPSILSADFCCLGQQIKEAVDAGAKYLHIDVMDGMFVPSISYGMPVIRSIRKASDCVFDVHIMIVDPIRYIKAFKDSGADIITFHLEAAEDAQAVIDMIHSYGIRAGISIKPATPVEELIPYLDTADMFLIMSVEPGKGGQKYIEESTARIKQLRKLLSDRRLPRDIEVDGGINTKNVRMIVEAGANVIVAGSAIFKGNIAGNVKSFLDEMKL